MRNYRNALTALALALVLTTPAFAGIMYTDRTPPPPTTTATSTTQGGATGGTSDSADTTTQSSTASDATADNSITVAVISLVQNAVTLI